MEMAKAHYEATVRAHDILLSTGATWESLSPDGRDHRYDAMWTALQLLRAPTEEMVEASWRQVERASPDERMAMELGDSRVAHKMKMARRFGAMIDKLLEVK